MNPRSLRRLRAGEQWGWVLRAGRHGHISRAEFGTDGCGRLQDDPVLRFELVKPPEDQIKNRRRQRTLDRARGMPQSPAVTLKGDCAAGNERIHRRHHDERIPSGQPMDHPRQCLDRTAAEALREIRAHVVFLERTKRRRRRRTGRPQLRRQTSHRRRGQRRRKRRIGGQDHRPQRRVTPGERAQQFDGFEIGPLQIVEHDHGGGVGGHRLEQRAHLSKHARRFIGAVFHRRRRVGNPRRQPPKPGRCVLRKQRRHRHGRLPRQVMQGIHDWLIGLGLARVRDRLSVTDSRGRNLPGHLHERVAEGGLTHAALAFDENHATVGAGMIGERRRESIEILVMVHENRRDRTVGESGWSSGASSTGAMNV